MTGTKGALGDKGMTGDTGSKGKIIVVQNKYESLWIKTHYTLYYLTCGPLSPSVPLSPRTPLSPDTPLSP
jgi:hypothetical protein